MLFLEHSLGMYLRSWGFRLYHLPGNRRGAGRLWGRRTRRRVLYVGLGIPSYVGEEAWEGAKFTGSNREGVLKAVKLL